VQGGPRSKCFLDDRLDPPVELRRFELAAEDRHTFEPRELEELGWYLLALGHEDAGKIEAEKTCERCAPLLGREGVEVGDLRFPQDMKPVGGKASGISGQRKPRTGDLRGRHRSIEPKLPGQCLELQRVSPPGQEVSEPKHQSGLRG
jgi:hypothetical protein